MAGGKWFRSWSGLVVVLLFGAAALVFVVSSWPSDPVGNVSNNYLFFSTDDGKTWFKAPAGSLPPFDHEGKPAYLAYVWSIDGGKTQFVSHLFRYTPEGMKRMQSQQRKEINKPSDAILGAVADSEVKRPGEPETAWVSLRDAKARAIMTPKSPDPKQVPQPVYP